MASAVCNLLVYVLCALRLGQFCGGCDRGVSDAVAFCLWLLWERVCMREVLPIIPPPLGRGNGVGRPALFSLLVPPL
jgi:hypothetical protein